MTDTEVRIHHRETGPDGAGGQIRVINHQELSRTRDDGDRHSSGETKCMTYPHIGTMIDVERPVPERAQCIQHLRLED